MGETELVISFTKVSSGLRALPIAASKGETKWLIIWSSTKSEQKLLVKRLLEENKSVSENAKTFNVHKATIYRLQD